MAVKGKDVFTGHEPDYIIGDMDDRDLSVPWEIEDHTDNKVLSKILEMEARDLIPSKIPLISIKPFVGALALEYKGDREGTGNEYAHLKQKDPSKKIPELLTLCFFYGIFLEKYQEFEFDHKKIKALNDRPEQFLHDTVTIYFPDYIKKIGMKPNINRKNKIRIIEKITGNPKTSGYAELLGVIKEEREGIPSAYREYEVIESFDYDSEKRTLSFASPYMTAVIGRVLEARIRKDSTGRPKYDKSGRLDLSAGHSDHLSPDILKGWHDRSAEVVGVVTTLIDRSGSRKSHIKFKNIIERCGRLRYDVYHASCVSSANAMLERVFVKAWEFLKEKTDISEKYKNFKFPDPKDPDNIPKVRTLEKTIEFCHNGKKRVRDTMD